MAGKRKPKKDDKEQSQRFVETARDLEIDESGQAFDRAMESVTEKKRSSQRGKS